MDYQEAIETLQDIHDVAETRIKSGDARGLVYIPRDGLNDIKNAISALQELQQYKKLGDQKIVRNAVERRKAKRPLYYGDTEDGEIECPHCHESLWDIKDCGFDNCPYCGQHIDWSEDI